MASNDSANGDSFESSEISLPRTVRFWLLLLFDIPSLICTFLLVYHIIYDQALRKALSNHVIILLLILGSTSEFFDVPSYLAFIANSGIVKPSVPSTCLIWWFVDIGMYNGGTIMMAWASIERHILIFKYQWVSTRKGRFLSHYFPIIILLLYIFIYYIYVLFIFPCENAYDYTLPICNQYPCYQSDPFFGIWDLIVNTTVPSLVVAFMSMALLIRVIQQKSRLNQHNQWRKQRKMTIQLVSLSALNVVFNIPLNLVSLAHLCGLPADYGVEAEQYFYFSCYFLIFFFPFVCLFSYPEVVTKFKSNILCRKLRPNATVAPAFLATHRRT